MMACMRGLAARLALPAAVIAAMAAVALGAAVSASGASWHLESAFGEQGVATLPARYTWSLLVPGDAGSMFVSGSVTCTAPPSKNPDRCAGISRSLFVAHVSARGGLVHGFGRAGVAKLPVLSAVASMFALGGGRLLVAGVDEAGELVLTRLSANGTVDRSFGHGGVARYALPGRDHGKLTFDVEHDGDILAIYQQAIGSRRIGSTVFVRLLPSGSLDARFGRGGFREAAGRPGLTIGLLGSVGGSTLAADGEIVLAEEGLEPHPGAKLEWGLEEFSAGGVSSASFGDGGLAVVHPGALELDSEAALRGLFALPGGGVEAAYEGTALVANPQAFLGQEFADEIALLRFSSSGAPDPAFGLAGKVTVGPQYQAVALAADGETLTVGTSGGALAIGGVLGDGAPDPAFGGSAGVRIPLPHGLMAFDASPVLDGVDGISLLVDAADVVRLGS
jgi:hypothetical protein